MLLHETCERSKCGGLNFLANFERDDYTIIYDHKIRSVYNAESLPWTWLYILTRFNRKHILCRRSLPCADRARKCLDELCWKIEWKHHYLEKQSETLPFRVPYQRTAVFNQLPCPSLRRLATPSQECCVSSFARGTVPGVRVSTAHVNTFPMIRWVLRRMRDGGWTLLPNDKEPGFCFIRHSETRDIAISSLVPGFYEESHFLDLWLPGMMKAYGVIAKGIGELHGKRTKSVVFVFAVE